VKYELGDKQGAIADYNEAIRLNPKDDGAYYNRACYYSLENNLELALSNLQKAIQLSPERYRQLSKTDKDFDNIRGEARFQKLLR
jgi:superkiller protein 3